MNNIMQDKYNLEQSKDKTMQNIKNGINLNLKLNSNTNKLTGLKIYGVVKDENGKLIKDATIKVMSSEYHPLFHTKTNSIGEYSFNNLPKDKLYNIFATSKGYMLQQNSVSLFLGTQNLNLNFVLKKDYDLKLGIISGTIINSVTKKVKENIIVKLISLNDENELLEAITYSNKKGQFIFSNIKKGKYLVNINALGYNTLNLETNIINDGQIVSLMASITEKANIKIGIISGYIKNCEANIFIEGADVILYEVKSDESLNPIAFTKTIKDGFYMFGNVPNGKYKIKSNELKEVEVNFPDDLSSSPNFYSFTLYNNQEKFSKTYYAKDVSLYGLARIENDFVENVGSLLGYLILKDIIIPKDGVYDLIIKYVTVDNNKVCNISINNLSTEILYGFEPTESLYLNSAKEKRIPLTLVQGENVIKIYNE